MAMAKVEEELSYLCPADQGRRPPMVVINENLVKRLSFSADESLEDSIAVYVRIKPPSIDCSAEIFNFSEEENTITVKKQNALHTFKFTHIFQPEINQIMLHRVCTWRYLKSFISGNNSFIFTYGASSSGKTYTVQGDGLAPGLIPRSLVTIFSSLKQNLSTSDHLGIMNGQVALLSADMSYNAYNYKKRIIESIKCMVPKLAKSKDYLTYKTFENLKAEINKVNLSSEDSRQVYTLWISYYEIYNEKIYDLLVEPQAEKVPLRLFNPKDQPVFIKELSYVQVHNLNEAYLLFMLGRQNLSVSATGLNNRSSRSHSIFMVTLVSQAQDDQNAYFKHCTFSVGDLAGVERADRTNQIGIRLGETQKINNSFLVLNRCLKAIRSFQSNNKTHVPWRDSKLTQIIGPSLLSSNIHFGMIVTICPDVSMLDDTIGTLNACSVATQIKSVCSPKPRRRRLGKFSIAATDFFCPGYKPNSHFLLGSTETLKPGISEDQEASTMDSYNELVKKMKDSDNQIVSLQEEIRMLKSENLMLKKSSSNVDTEKIKDEQILFLQDQIRKLKSQDTSSVEKNADLIKEIEEYKSTENQLRIELLRLQKKHRIMREEKEKYEQLLVDAKDEIDDLQDFIDNLETKLEKKDQENRCLKEEIEEANEYVRIKDDKIQELEEELMEKDTIIQNSNSTIQNLTRELNELKKDPRLQNIEVTSEDEVIEVVELSSPDDSDFKLPSKPRTRKKRGAVKNERAAGYLTAVSDNSTGASRSNSRSPNRRKLFTPSVLITSAGDNSSTSLAVDEADVTQLSPSSLMKRTLRTGKQY